MRKMIPGIIKSEKVAAMEQLRRVEQSLEMRAKAMSYMRYAVALGLAKGHRTEATEIFRARWPNSTHSDVIKAAVSVGSTSDSSWAGPLAPLRQFSSAFVDYLRPLTVIGRMAGFRNIPFNVLVPRQTSGTSVNWVGQGQSAPVSNPNTDSITFADSKIAGIVVLSRELVKLSNPAAEALIQQDLTATVVEFSDQQFLDPTIAAVADVSPASITHGATAIPSSGSSATQVEADLLALFAAVTTNLASPYLIMKQTTALYLATLRTTSGDRLFPDVGARGGQIWGVQVLTTTNMPLFDDSPQSSYIVLIDASEILLADDGIAFAASEHALLQMNTAPDNPTSASSVMVSLWQHGLVGIMAVRHMRWARRREGSVAYISDVGY